MACCDLELQPPSIPWPDWGPKLMMKATMMIPKMIQMTRLFEFRRIVSSIAAHPKGNRAARQGQAGPRERFPAAGKALCGRSRCEPRRLPSGASPGRAGRSDPGRCDSDPENLLQIKRSAWYSLQAG